jgi:NAD(P)-dependent dehydrogenase (short-subunit alcohol dehydrogenase family)
LTLDSVREESSGAGIDRMISTNLITPIQLTRLALAFIKVSPPFTGEGQEKFVPSVTFTSSLAGLTPTRGMTVYSTTKHGFVGLMRSLPHNKGLVRFNAVCPSATDTGMLPEFVKEAWKGAGFRMQSAEDVARSLVGCVSDAGMDKRAVVVAGGKPWDSEGELEKLRGAWLEEENGKEVDDSAAFYFVSFGEYR